MFNWIQEDDILYSEDRYFCIMTTRDNMFRLFSWDDFTNSYESHYDDFYELNDAKYQAWLEYVYPDK